MFNTRKPWDGVNLVNGKLRSFAVKVSIATMTKVETAPKSIANLRILPILDAIAGSFSIFDRFGVEGRLKFALGLKLAYRCIGNRGPCEIGEGSDETLLAIALCTVEISSFPKTS